ncbi:MAG: hypothetical protein HFI51_06580 [Lachnospiraceae bacterium]|nr:hypothetical protein [Lachnospiraceae bacterium]
MEKQEKRQVPVERKMRLAQYIRAENMDNRMKIRQREQILYGTENLPPVWNKNEPLRPERYELQGGGGTEEPAPVSNTFRLRMAAAILLFIGFLLCDAGQYRLFGYSMNDIYGMISEDYFSLYDAENPAEMPQLSELLK